jgi:hypothetical protein
MRKERIRNLAANALIALILLALFMPRIVYGKWTFTDDGVFLDLLSHITSDVKAGHVGGILEGFHSAGRFIPVAMIFYALRLRICGLSAGCHYIVQFLLAAISCLALYYLVINVTRNTVAAILGTTTFILFYANWEDFYRLYPIENIVTPLSGLFVLCLYHVNRSHVSLKELRGAVFAMMLCTYALALFSKESAIVLIVPVLYGALFSGISRDPQLSGAARGWRVSFLGASCVGTIWYLIRAASGLSGYASGWYASNYRMDLLRLLQNCGKYFDVFINAGGMLLVAVFAYWVFLFASNRKSVDSTNSKTLFWLGLLFIMGSASMVVLLPWKFAIGRYLMPAAWSFAAMLGIMLSEVMRVGRQGRRKAAAVGIAVALGVIGYAGINLIRINNMIKWTETRDSANAELIGDLAGVEGIDKRCIYFMLPPDVETASHVDPILRHLYGKGPRNVQSYDAAMGRVGRPGDLIVIPLSEGDGHFSCDGVYSAQYYKGCEVEIRSFTRLREYVEARSSSVTIYCDYDIYNYIKGQRINLPAAIMGTGPYRSLVARQELVCGWGIYEVIS